MTEEQRRSEANHRNHVAQTRTNKADKNKSATEQTSREIGEQIAHNHTSASSLLPWLVFAGCCVMSFVGYGLLINTAGLYFDAISRDLEVSRAASALPVSIRLITSALAMLVVGRVFNRLNLRLALSVCMVVCSSAFVACAFCTDMWQFNIAFAIMGVTYVLPVTIAPPLLLSSWFPERFGTVMGISGCLSGFGGALFNPIVSMVITQYGWRTSYALTGMTLAILLLPFTMTVFRLAPQSESRSATQSKRASQRIRQATANASSAGASSTAPRHTKTSSDCRTTLFTNQAFLLLIAAMVMLQIVAGINQHIPAYEISIGLTLTQGALVVTSRMFGAAAGKFAIGPMLDHLRPPHVIFGFAVIGLIGWTGLWVANRPTAAIATSFLVGIGQGLLMVALPWVIRHVFGADDYARTLSVIDAAGQATVAIATTAHGLVFDMTGTYAPSLMINIVLYGCATCCIIAAWRRREH